MPGDTWRFMKMVNSSQWCLTMTMSRLPGRWTQFHAYTCPAGLQRVRDKRCQGGSGGDIHESLQRAKSDLDESAAAVAAADDVDDDDADVDDDVYPDDPEDHYQHDDFGSYDDYQWLPMIINDYILY